MLYMFSEMHLNLVYIFIFAGLSFYTWRQKRDCHYGDQHIFYGKFKMP